MKTGVRVGWAFIAAIGFASVFPSAASARQEVVFAQLVMDASTGRVLHAVNPDTQTYPASLTKMMTLYLVFEALDDGRLKLSDRVRFSDNAARQAPSRLGIAAGKSISVREAILAVVTKSANDVAVALAERVGGTETQFAQLMTARAHKLGMSRTIFRNASGLPHKGQLSTARDMATLSRALLRNFPHHYHFFGAASFSYAGVSHKNHNQMIQNYDGADGIKTGYIRASGFNLAASAKRDGRRLIGVVLGDRSPTLRNRRMADLLDQGFSVLHGVAVAGGYPAAPSGTKVATSAPPANAASNAKVAAAKSAPAKTVPPRKETASVERTVAERHAPARGARPTASGDAGWAIQVGAFHREAQAQQAAEKATAQASALLSDGEIRIVGTQRARGKSLYRARIVNLTKNQAHRACTVLRARNMPCLQMRDDDVQVASAES